MKQALWAFLLAAGCASPAKPAPPAAPAAKPSPPPVSAAPIAVDLSKFASVTNLAGREEHFSTDDGEGRMSFFSNLVAQGPVQVAADGDYEIVVTASCQAALDVFAALKVHVDGAAVGEIALTSEDAKEYRKAAPLKAGARQIGIEFTNDTWKEGEYDRNLFIHKIELRRVR